MSALHGAMRELFRAPSHHLAVVTPDDLPRCSARGAVPLRVLAVGGQLLAGFGVRSHELGLGGALARQVAAATGSGVDVDLEILDSTALDHVGRVLAHLPLSDIDALVLVLDAADLPRRAAEVRERVTRLLTAVAMRVPAPACTTVAVGPPVARLLDGVTGRPAVEGEVGLAVRSAVLDVEGSELVLLPASPMRTPGEAARTYDELAQPIAASLVRRIAGPAAGREPFQRLDEVARQDAVDRLRPFDPRWEAGFQRIVEGARTAYGTRSAALSVVDGGLTRFLQRRGFDLGEISRLETICDAAIRYRGGLVVGDAYTDERFRDRYAVRGGMAGFYVGHPVRSPEGQAVAALCVFDPQPRQVDGGEAIVLRDFAIAAERRMWETWRPPARAAGVTSRGPLSPGAQRTLAPSSCPVGGRVRTCLRARPDAIVRE